VSCHGFFHIEHKEFGNLLITDCTIAVNKMMERWKPMSWCGRMVTDVTEGTGSSSWERLKRGCS
jgi:hypothetical protein